MADEPAGDGLSSTARAMRAVAPYLGAVWKLVGAAVVGVVGGYALDSWLETTPWLMVALSLVGISVGFFAFIRAVLQLGRR